MNEKVKKCIDYYIKNIDTDEYNIEKDKSEKRGGLVHRKYIEENKPQWKSRTDNYDGADIAQVVMIDILSNDGVGKLIKKLYALPKEKFKVKNYYKKPTLIHRYDYVQLQYTRSEVGRFAEIEILNDKYLREITISWSQVNNYYAVLQYTFLFKRCMDDELYSSFMCDNIKKLTSKDYVIWYNIIEENRIDELMLTQMHRDYFPLLMQHYITTYLYTEQGKSNPLVNFICFTRKEPIDINKLYLGDFTVSYYNKKENYVISSDSDAINYCLCAGNNRIPSFSIIGYIAKYKNDFYYRFGGTRELRIFEKEFSGFTSGRKRVSYNKNYRALLNKLQGMKEIPLTAKEDIYKQFDLNWEFYVGNDKTNIKKYHNKMRKINYQKIYQDNFSYLNLLSQMNITQSNYIISIVAVLVSIIAIIISILISTKDVTAITDLGHLTM